MTGWEYLTAILVSFGAMVLVDHRWRVFLWAHPRRAGVVMACGIFLFLLWDVAGIATGIFERGDSPGMTGIEIVPDLPLEELFFVTFLCYLTMVLHGLVTRFVFPERMDGLQAAPVAAPHVVPAEGEPT